MMNHIFKKNSTHDLYWHLKGSIIDFNYEWADAKYCDHDPLRACQKLIELTKSKANPEKFMRKCEWIFKNATYAFDLPEHPEKHNGYLNDHQYENAVMAALGFTFFQRGGVILNSKTPDELTTK